MPYDLTAKTAFADLVAHVWFHDQAVQNAALLLGGPDWLRRAQRLLGDLVSAPRLTRRLDRELRALHALLTFEHVGDLDRLETALFAELDPEDPVVADLCLLADALEEHLGNAEQEASLSHLMSAA
ncbi:hypothetical protein [Tranquillimonas alkanivorans]|uniref:Uncharacterized protein n=1 Tax=Tranquillimonas alkanivorans TaxID=441119 RepID=A0A1I5VSV4_9RHOB|nr:hypothetical protein [Tranquillimonas alkanivorans]SFQ10540.1 hypothetical protein SAMN04488047_13518 [Tranquillimonas alkanivorans]